MSDRWMVVLWFAVLGMAAVTAWQGSVAYRAYRGFSSARSACETTSANEANDAFITMELALAECQEELQRTCSYFSLGGVFFIVASMAGPIRKEAKLLVKLADRVAELDPAQ